MKLIPWGVRGSFPAAEEGFLVYGGNTSCYSLSLLSQERDLVVWDAGSGLAALAKWLRPREEIRNIHIFLSHAHIDHLMGLYPFLSGIGREREVHLYGGSALDALERLIARPYWPCSLAESGARLHRVTPGVPFPLEGADGTALVTAMEGTHPGGCLWYRLDWRGRSVVYLLDCEVEASRWPEMLAFARGAGLVVWDASFPPGGEKPGWGHSTWEKGAAFCREAGAARVLMGHYAPEMDDPAILRLDLDAARMGDICIFAREGMEIDL